jgi:hypothetical protein
MQTHGEIEHHAFLTSAQVSGHAPATLPPRKVLRTHWIGGPQSRSVLCGEEKNLTLPGIEPRPSSP